MVSAGVDTRVAVEEAAGADAELGRPRGLSLV